MKKLMNNKPARVLPLPRWVRKATLLAAPAAVLVTAAVVRADVPNTFATGDTLSAQALNDNFKALVDLSTDQTIGGNKSFSGRVGIGTTAPASPLHVAGPGWLGGAITAQSTDHATGIQVQGFNGPGIQDTAFIGLFDQVAAHAAFIGLTGDAGAGPNGPGDLRFIVGGNVERMRISATTGGVGIGTATPAPGYLLDVNGIARAAAWITASDARLKTDVRTIDDALGSVSRLRGVRFTRLSDGQPSIGVIAQEVERVYPELVKTSGDGMKGVEYDKLVGVLIEATKELAAQNRALAARNRVLEERHLQVEQSHVELAARLDRMEKLVERMGAR